MNAILVLLLLLPKLTLAIPLASEIDCKNRTHLCRTTVQFYSCVRIGENKTIVGSLEAQNCPDGFVCNAEMDTACHNIDYDTRNKLSSEEAYSIKKYLSSFENYRELIGESNIKPGQLSLNFNSENNVKNIVKEEEVSTIIEESSIAGNRINKQRTVTLNQGEFNASTPRYYMFTHDTTVTDEISYNTNFYASSTIFDEEQSTQSSFAVEENASKVIDNLNYSPTADILGDSVDSTTVNNVFPMEEKDFNIDNNTLKTNITTAIPPYIANQTIYDSNIASTEIDHNQINYHNIISKNVDGNNTDNHIEEHETSPLISITANVNLLETSTENDNSWTIQNRETDETSTVFQEVQSEFFENYTTVNNISSYDETVTINPETISDYLTGAHVNKSYSEDNTSSISLVENLLFTTVDDATNSFTEKIESKFDVGNAMFKDVSTITLEISEETSTQYQFRNTNFEIDGITKHMDESEEYYQEHIESTRPNSIEKEVSTFDSFVSQNSDGNFDERTTLAILDDSQLLSALNQDYSLINEANIESTSTNSMQIEVSTFVSFAPQSTDGNLDERAAFIETKITESSESIIGTTTDAQSPDSFASTSADEEPTLIILKDTQQLSTMNQDYSLANEENNESTSTNNEREEISAITSFAFQSGSEADETTKPIKIAITESVEKDIDTTIEMQSLFSSRTDTYSYTYADGELSSTILDNFHQLSTLNQDYSLINDKAIESASPNSIEKEVSASDSFVFQSNDENFDEGTAFMKTKITESTESSIGITTSTQSIFSSRIDSFPSTKADEESTSAILHDSQPLFTLNQDYSSINEENIVYTRTDSMQIEVSTVDSLAPQSSDGNLDERAAFIETKITESSESIIGTTTDAQSPDSFASTSADEEPTSIILKDTPQLSTINQYYSLANEENNESTSTNNEREEISTITSFVFQTDSEADETTKPIKITITESVENGIDTTIEMQSQFSSRTDGYSYTHVDGELSSRILDNLHQLSTLNQDYSLTNDKDIESTSPNSIEEEVSASDSFVFQSNDENFDEGTAFIETKITESTESSIGITTSAQSIFSSRIDSFPSTKADDESTSAILHDSQPLFTLNQDYSSINDENIESTRTNSMQIELSTFDSLAPQSTDGNLDERAAFVETKITESSESIIGTTTDAQSSDSFASTSADAEPTLIILKDTQQLSTMNQDYSLANEENNESTSTNNEREEISTITSFAFQTDSEADEITKPIKIAIPESVEHDIDTTIEMQSPFLSRTDSYSYTHADGELSSTILDNFHQLSTLNQNYSLINDEDIEFTSPNSIEKEFSTFDGLVSQSSDGNFDERAAFIETKITESTESSINITTSTQSIFLIGIDSFSSTKTDEAPLRDSQLSSTLNQKYSLENEENIESTSTNSMQIEVSTFDSFVSQGTDGNLDERAAFIGTTITESSKSSIETTNGAQLTFSSHTDSSPWTNADEVSTILNDSQLLSTHNQVNVSEEDVLMSTSNINDVGTIASNMDETIEIRLRSEGYTTESVASPLVFSQSSLQRKEDIDQIFDTGSTYADVHEEELITESIFGDDKRELGVVSEAAEISLNENATENVRTMLHQNVFIEVIGEATSFANMGIVAEISTPSSVSLDREILYTNSDMLSMYATNNESTTVRLESLEQVKEGELLFENTKANIEIEFGTKDVSAISNKVEVNSSNVQYAESNSTVNLSKLDVEKSARTESSLNLGTPIESKPKRQATANVPLATPASILSEFKCTSPGKFPDPRDCSVYHYCVDILIEFVHVLKRCPPGTLYDRVVEICTRKPVRCSADIVVPTCNASGVFPHPTDCSLYYKCFWWFARGKFTLWQFECPAHMKYDPQRAVCVNGALFPNCASSIDSPPFYCSENGRFPVEYTCDSYYECKRKKTEFMKKVKFCSPGKLFDRELGTCRKSSQVFCPYKYDNVPAESFEEFNEED